MWRESARLLADTTSELYFIILTNNTGLEGLQLLKVGQNFGPKSHTEIRKHEH